MEVMMAKLIAPMVKMMAFKRVILRVVSPRSVLRSIASSTCVWSAPAVLWESVAAAAMLVYSIAGVILPLPLYPTSTMR